MYGLNVFMYIYVCMYEGERHIKLWSFRRPQKDGPVSLMSKSCSMGKVNGVCGPHLS